MSKLVVLLVCIWPISANLVDYVCRMFRSVRVGPSQSAGITFWTDRTREIISGDRVVKLGPMIGQGMNSAVYPIVGTPFVIKYKIFNRDDDEIANEFVFANEVYLLNPLITTRMEELGPVFDLPPGRGKVDRDNVFFKPPPMVRYLISERGRMSLWKYHSKNRRISLADALSIGISIVRSLHQIHTVTRIVHGDIHLGNILFTIDQSRVLITDWGRAKRMGRGSGVEDSSHSGKCHSAYSPWEITNGESHSFRTDIYRTILIVVSLVQGVAFRSILAILCDEGFVNYHVDIKTKMNLFDLTIGHPERRGAAMDFTIGRMTGVDRLPNDTLMRLGELTANLLLEVRAPLTKYDMPDYERIEKLMEDISRVSSGVRDTN
jgi:serine/threonine protein kinase